jgi:translation initiation factor IF-2
MSEERTERLGKVVRELNIAVSRAIDFLNSKGYNFRNDPNAKINEEQYKLLRKEFGTDLQDKKEASHLSIGKKTAENFVIDYSTVNVKPVKDDSELFIKPNTPPVAATQPTSAPVEPQKIDVAKPELVEAARVKLEGLTVKGKIDLSPKKPTPPAPVEKPLPQIQEKVEDTPKIVEAPEPIQVKVPEPLITIPENQPVEEIPTQLIEAKGETLKGLTVLGKIELAQEKPPVKKEFHKPHFDGDKKKRKRIIVEGNAGKPATPGQFQPKDGQAKGKPGFNQKEKPVIKEEITDKQIQEQIKNTLAKLSGNKNNVSRSKYRKDKRSAAAEAHEERMQLEEHEKSILKVTEFISASDLASLMDVSVNEIIAMCMNLGMFVSINQRLDAETIQIIAEEFGYKTQFTSAEDEIAVEDGEDDPDTLEDRPPIVTIMGHVDHGKTSLLDYIRKSNVTAKEAGGITQHIGAYDVVTEKGKKITFLDTPGHEAFTAMRARGAKVTDIVIIVVAADDGVMPQTKEALNHALSAQVPIIIAINKIDKPGANPDRIKEQLSAENILVEDWGGKYQCESISAKSGKGVPELLEKILLEAELLELKANPKKAAVGTVIEAALDKGRGYVTTLLVQAGTMEVGDIILAGQFYGRVKAMNDHKGLRLKAAGPSKPLQMLGLPGAPQAGDKFNIMKSEAEAREIANKREQILREQSMRTKKHITLDEIGRRLAIGNFKQLNVIIKGDFDGSIQAISDSLLKLSTQEIQVAIIHKAVGAISESDVLLASASDAVIIGFQVRPTLNAKRIAENEEIEIRLYSVIYDAINDLKAAMEGMLEPTFEEHIQGTAEVKEVFKINKVGSIAGCLLIEGNIKRQGTEVRVIRDGIVQHTGKFASLKRFKDDVSEVKYGQDCGIGIENYNDVQVGDFIEIFEKREVKRKLS